MPPPVLADPRAPAPFGMDEGWHVIEQHGYAEATDSIETLDLCAPAPPRRKHGPI